MILPFSKSVNLNMGVVRKKQENVFGGNKKYTNLGLQKICVYYFTIFIKKTKNATFLTDNIKK
jgi:hypothetical protein